MTLVVMLIAGTTVLRAQADITDVQAVVEKRENPNTGREEAWVVIDYVISDVPTAGALLTMEVELTDKVDGGTFSFVPLDEDVEGDYGDITSDGAKRIEWNAERSLTHTNDQGKYDATITLQLQGNGDPTEAILNITSYAGSGWQYFDPGTAKLVNLRKTSGFTPVCEPVQGENWHETVSGDKVVWYKGDLVAFPSYRGRRTNDPIRGTPRAGTGCSSFLAVENLGTPQQKVWVLFAQAWNMILTTNNTSFVWEFQARYFESGAGSNRSLKLGNAGKPGQQQFEELSFGEDFELELKAGPGEQERSNTFELEVVRRQFKYFYQGQHVMTFFATGDGYFEGDGANKIKLKEGDLKINNSLLSVVLRD